MLNSGNEITDRAKDIKRDANVYAGDTVVPIDRQDLRNVWNEGDAYLVSTSANAAYRIGCSDRSHLVLQTDPLRFKPTFEYRAVDARTDHLLPSIHRPES